MSMSGSSTNTTGALWFCHVCMWSGWLSVGDPPHVCKGREWMQVAR